MAIQAFLGHRWPYGILLWVSNTEITGKNLIKPSFLLDFDTEQCLQQSNFLINANKQLLNDKNGESRFINTFFEFYLKSHWVTYDPNVIYFTTDFWS